jgi:hypothetical protein
MYSLDGVLELSTESGAEMAGRAMLAARRSRLICICTMFSENALRGSGGCECSQKNEEDHLNGKDSLCSRGCAFRDLFSS